MRFTWKCHTVRPLLWDYVAGRLPEARQGAVAKHLETCAACRAHERRMNAVRGPLEAARREALPDIPGVWQAIAPRLDAPTAEVAPRSRQMLRPAFALGGAALCGLGAFVFLRTRPEKPRTQPARQAGIATALRRETPGVRGAQSSRTERAALRGVPPTPPEDARREPQAAFSSQPQDAVGQVARPRVADAVYLNGQDAPAPKFADADAPALPQFAEANLRDDFIVAEPPRIAGAGSDEQQKRQDAAALREYERQQAIVDTRLFRKVTLAEKGESIEAICAHLQAQTGVKLNGTRDVADEKLTVFVGKMPARDVMRAISRLLGYKWMRYGEEGAFYYRLTQPMRSRMDEEEMRSRDDNAALLALDAEMKRKRAEAEALDAQIATAEHSPKPQSKEERVEREARIAALKAEKAQQKNSPMVTAYDQLTPADQVAMRGGAEIALDPDDLQPDRQVAPELQKQLCVGFPDIYINDRSDNWLSFDADKGVKYSEFAGARVGLSYAISRSELGQLTLEGTPHFSLWLPKIGKSRLGMYGELPQTLASGKNPSAAKPDNRKANRLLTNTEPFARPVELKPEHVCHLPQAANREDPLDPKRQAATADDMYSRPEHFFSQHAESSDVWEAVHKKTGLPIVADYYSRLVPLDSVQLPRLPLFEALCREGDALGVKWQKDGDFLLCRSTGYFWDKLKEVPRRQLERWAKDAASDGLPFDDFLEMAQCSDAALDSLRVGQAIWTCWGLEEWERVSVSRDGRRDSPMAGIGFRGLARCLANFPLPLRDGLTQPGGMNFRDLPFQQQQELMNARSPWSYSPEIWRDSQIHVDYVPAGRHVWNPAPGSLHLLGISATQVVSGRTAEETLAAAQKIEPTATRGQIHRSRCVFAIELNQGRPTQQIVGAPLETLH